jgi:hypothetical protein
MQNKSENLLAAEESLLLERLADLLAQERLITPDEKAKLLRRIREAYR